MARRKKPSLHMPERREVPDNVKITPPTGPQTFDSPPPIPPDPPKPPELPGPDGP